MKVRDKSLEASDSPKKERVYYHGQFFNSRWNPERRRGDRECSVSLREEQNCWKFASRSWTHYFLPFTPQGVSKVCIKK